MPSILPNRAGATRRRIATLEQRIADAEFSRNFNAQKWNECTIALKENMDTINDLQAQLTAAVQEREEQKQMYSQIIAEGWLRETALEAKAQRYREALVRLLQGDDQQVVVADLQAALADAAETGGNQ